jgi:RHS repeat-associated protein
MGMQGVTSGIDNKYLYQGKELQPDAFKVNGVNHLLEWYDFSARNYDPQIGRWHVADPANQYVSPYLAMGNNPVNSIDPTGCENIGGSRFPIDGFARMNAYHAEYNNWLDGSIGRGTAGFWAGLYMEGYYLSGGGGGSGGGGCGGGGGGGASFGGLPQIIATTVTTNFGGGIILTYGTRQDFDVTQAAKDAGYVYRDYRGGWGIETQTNYRYYDKDCTIGNGKTIDSNISWVSMAQAGGGNALYNVANAINEFNPIANLWDVVAYAFTGKDRFGNDMSLGQGMLKAAAVIPVGKVGNITVKTLQLTGKARTAEQGLLLGERFLGIGYSEIDNGVFRSADGLRQFRMTNSDLLGRGFNDIPHIHFESYYPFNLNTPYVNWHVPLINP